MPTYHISVLKHQQRESDRKFPVSIRITHNRRSVYLKTDFYVVRQQLNKVYELKDMTIQKLVLERIEECERLIVCSLGNDVVNYSAAELKAFIENRKDAVVDVDFIVFARGVVERLCGLGRSKRARHIKTTINSITDFIRRDSLGVREVTSSFLRDYECFLRSDRRIVRLNQFGREVVSYRKPLSDTGVHDYLADVRAVFNEAVCVYNDDDGDEVVIKHYPFRKFKIVNPAMARKRNICIEDVRKVVGFQCAGRGELGRDVFLLSFYLVGVNTVDLFRMEGGCLKDGRVVYRRSKTTGRRADGAEISIKVEPEMRGVFEKYRDPDGVRLFRFYRMYANDSIFNAAVNKGLKQVSAECGLTECVTAYYARHSWATIARNRLNVSTDDIALCLNHVNEGHRVTDVYIEKDFTRIDVANRRMIDLLKGVE